MSKDIGPFLLSLFLDDAVVKGDDEVLEQNKEGIKDEGVASHQNRLGEPIGSQICFGDDVGADQGVDERCPAADKQPEENVGEKAVELLAFDEDVRFALARLVLDDVEQGVNEDFVEDAHRESEDQHQDDGGVRILEEIAKAHLEKIKLHPEKPEFQNDRLDGVGNFGKPVGFRDVVLVRHVVFVFRFRVRIANHGEFYCFLTPQKLYCT